jgi:hypothetical protein
MIVDFFVAKIQQLRQKQMQKYIKKQNEYQPKTEAGINIKEIVKIMIENQESIKAFKEKSQKKITIPQTNLRQSKYRFFFYVFRFNKRCSPSFLCGVIFCVNSVFVPKR